MLVRCRGATSAAGNVLRRLAILAILGAGIISAYVPPGKATAVEQKTLLELVKGAELIFEGQVVASNVVPGADGAMPRTCVTFDISDVIVGSHPDRSLVLCFLGGEVNGQRTVVTDMHYPAVGEHGIYLVESTKQPMVNPLIGWDQGRFLVENDPVSGTPKMLTANRRPIQRIVAAAGEAAIVGPGATALGVVSGNGPDMTGAMGREDFKTWLRAAHGR